jgi:hypothetical protein
MTKEVFELINGGESIASLSRKTVIFHIILFTILIQKLKYRIKKIIMKNDY